MRHAIDAHGAVASSVVEGGFGGLVECHRLSGVPDAAAVALTLGGWTNVTDRELARDAARLRSGYRAVTRADVWEWAESHPTDRAATYAMVRAMLDL